MDSFRFIIRRIIITDKRGWGVIPDDGCGKAGDREIAKKEGDELLKAFSGEKKKPGEHPEQVYICPAWHCALPKGTT